MAVHLVVVHLTVALSRTGGATLPAIRLLRLGMVMALALAIQLPRMQVNPCKGVQMARMEWETPVLASQRQLRLVHCYPPL